MKISFQINLKTVMVYAVIILLTLELAPFLMGSFILNGGYSRKEVKEDLKFPTDPEEILTEGLAGQHEDYLSEHMVHPYLGFVHKPDSYYNEYGFPMTGPLLQHDTNTINLCITGGSVAKQLVQFSGDELIHQLTAQPGFEGKNIKLATIALGGFKQPQQLLAINYLLSLGAKYDYVINLDGFNEVVLPFSDNRPFGIFPAFPRHWNVYSQKMLDQETIGIIGKQLFLKEDQEKTGKKFASGVFRFSNFGLFLWKILDNRYTQKILAMEILLRDQLMNSTLPPQTVGPEYHFSDTTEFFREQVEYWSQCSKQMQALASHFGFLYYHFLQPNQYLPESKMLTGDELEMAYEKGEFIYKDAVQKAYPLMIHEGLALSTQGVNFTDLTGIFINEKATVYSDKCCHFNKRGYDLIVSQIVTTITTGK